MSCLYPFLTSKQYCHFLVDHVFSLGGDTQICWDMVTRTSPNTVEFFENFVLKYKEALPDQVYKRQQFICRLSAYLVVHLCTMYLLTQVVWIVQLVSSRSDNFSTKVFYTVNVICIPKVDLDIIVLPFLVNFVISIVCCPLGMHPIPFLLTFTCC